MTLAEAAISTPVILFKAGSRPLHHAGPAGRPALLSGPDCCEFYKKTFKKGGGEAVPPFIC